MKICMSMERQSLLKKDFIAVLFTCSICRSNLHGYQNPKLLPCLHSLCYECLCNLEIEKCGFCEQEFKAHSVNNHILLGQFSRTKTRGELECSSCDDAAQAICLCLNCKEILCEPCLKAHRRVRATKSHSIKEPLNREHLVALLNREYCPDHPEELLKYYCSQCGKETCSECQYHKHMGHIFTTLKEERDAAAKFIKDWCHQNDIYKERSDMYEEYYKCCEKITRHDDETSQIIKDFSVWCNQLIKKNVKDKLKLLKENYQEEIQSNKQCLEQLNQLWLQLDHYAAFVKNILVTTDDFALLFRVKAIKMKLIKVLNSEAPTSETRVNDLEFEYIINNDVLDQLLTLKI